MATPVYISPKRYVRYEAALDEDSGYAAVLQVMYFVDPLTNATDVRVLCLHSKCADGEAVGIAAKLNKRGR